MKRINTKEFAEIFDFSLVKDNVVVVTPKDFSRLQKELSGLDYSDNIKKNLLENVYIFTGDVKASAIIKESNIDLMPAYITFNVTKRSYKVAYFNSIEDLIQLK